jgi:hypothetical protein
MPRNLSSSESSTLSQAEMGRIEPFEQISTPGCYILKQTGTLLRVPPDALIPGRSPAIDVVSRDPWFVAKISNDPYIVLSKARAIAADLDLPVNF